MFGFYQAFIVMTAEVLNEWFLNLKNFNLIIYVVFHNVMVSFFLFDMSALCFFEFSSDLFHLALDNIPLCV